MAKFIALPEIESRTVPASVFPSSKKISSVSPSSTAGISKSGMENPRWSRSDRITRSSPSIYSLPTFSNGGSTCSVMARTSTTWPGAARTLSARRIASVLVNRLRGEGTGILDSPAGIMSSKASPLRPGYPGDSSRKTGSVSS